MTFQQKHEALLQEVVAKLRTITDRPKNENGAWLPHTVYIEQEGEDSQGRGVPVYTQFKLLDFDTDGACTLLNVALDEVEDNYYLSEIQLEWLITLLNWYDELTSSNNQSKA